MDIVLRVCDYYFLDNAWARILPVRVPIEDAVGHLDSLRKVTPSSTSIQAVATALVDYASRQESHLEQTEWTTVSAWGRDDWRRQFLSLCTITMIGIHLMYFIVAGMSYLFLYDHRMMKHPRFIKGQIGMEIRSSLWAFPWLTLMIVPSFLAETRGWTLLYDDVKDGPFGGGAAGWAYIALSCAFFIAFTDTLIYFIHRFEHHPSVYKHIHKPHHRWVIPTPFASHAFHPLDGYVQSLPYHVAVFLFPIHKGAYLALFVFVNLWTIMIHDSDMIVDHPLEKIVNGPAHHTLHHSQFSVNYGQFSTFCDRIFGSYRHPAKSDDPLLVVLAAQERKNQKEASNELLAQAERQEAEYLKAIAATESKSKLS